MLTQVRAHDYTFTVAGDHGTLSVYDGAGRQIATGLGSVADAERWCRNHAARLPQKPPVFRPEAAGGGRDRRTGY